MKRLNLTLVLLLIAGLTSVAPLFTKLGSYDFWWHLKAGEYIWETGAIPTTDPFSFTMQGQPWTAHEWLFEAAMWLFYQFGGLWGEMLLFFLVGLATVMLTWKLYQLRFEGGPDAGRSLMLAVLVGLVVCPTLPYWNPRPGVLSYLLFVLFLYVLRLVQTTRNTRLLWFLPILMVPWVNAHGSFVLGPALIFGELVFGLKSFSIGRLQSAQVEPQVRKGLGLAFAGSLLAAGLNPHGYGMFKYTATITTHTLMKNSIAEWLSPDFHQAYFAFVVAAVVLPSLFWILTDTGGDTVQDMVYLVGLTFMFLSSQRYFPFLAIYTGFILARRVPSSKVLKRVDRWPVSAVLLGSIIVVLVVKFPPSDVASHVSVEEFPVEAVEYLESNDVQGRIFNRYGWGGYLIWTTYPERQVFIDGRADLYLTSDVFEDYVDSTHLRVDPQGILDKYDIDYVLMESDCIFVRYLLATGDWKTVYEDDTAAILGRAE